MEKLNSQMLGRRSRSRGDWRESGWVLVQFGGDGVEVGCYNSAYLGDGWQVLVSGMRCTLPMVQDSAPEGLGH